MDVEREDRAMQAAARRRQAREERQNADPMDQPSGIAMKIDLEGVGVLRLTHGDVEKLARALNLDRRIAAIATEKVVELLGEHLFGGEK